MHLNEMSILFISLVYAFKKKKIWEHLGDPWTIIWKSLIWRIEIYILEACQLLVQEVNDNHAKHKTGENCEKSCNSYKTNVKIANHNLQLVLA